MENTLKTYKVPEQNLSKLQAQMAKLVHRCNRVKIAAPVLTVGAFEETADTFEGITTVTRVYNVTLESAGRPKIDGYEFAAVLSPATDEDGHFLGNVLRRVPGFEGDIPAIYRDANNYCDHCKSIRRRLETFVIHSAAGFRQIGRNCLANYLGMTDPERYISMAELLIDADDLMAMAEDEGFGGGSGTDPRLLMSEVLELTASAIRLYGWLSNKSAREFEKTSTSSRVTNWIFGSARTREQFEHKLIVSEEDKALAASTIEWLGTLSTSDPSDYVANLALLAKSVSIKSKNFGIACSAINAYSKEREFQIRRNARIEGDSKSEFIGEVGERRKFEGATVVYTNSFESEFGVSHLYKMKIGDNVVVYFSSRELWNQGDVIPEFTATVKKHENRVDKYSPDGVKQTVVTRATLPKEPPTDAQKRAHKAALKLGRIMKKSGFLTSRGPISAWQAKEEGRPEDYEAYITLSQLQWELFEEERQ